MREAAEDYHHTDAARGTNDMIGNWWNLYFYYCYRTNTPYQQKGPLHGKSDESGVSAQPQHGEVLVRIKSSTICGTRTIYGWKPGQS